MKRAKDKKDKTDNNRVYKAAQNRCNLKCGICPPNKGCNNKSHKKHGETKPKYKDKK